MAAIEREEIVESTKKVRGFRCDFCEQEFWEDEGVKKHPVYFKSPSRHSYMIEDSFDLEKHLEALSLIEFDDMYSEYRPTNLYRALHNVASNRRVLGDEIVLVLNPPETVKPDAEVCDYCKDNMKQ